MNWEVIAQCNWEFIAQYRTNLIGRSKNLSSYSCQTVNVLKLRSYMNWVQLDQLVIVQWLDSLRLVCETVDVALIVNGGAPFFQCVEPENRCFVLVDECIHVIENGDLILQVERKNALL
ncbi:hypothetical protein P8452_10445 [Trifolium repens]|nr:hypothetical protein P8452_10445 [Trifolium repens]